jgi:hypothetical protein
VTLISPADGISLTGVVTFAWAFDPGPLPEGQAFQLVFGRGDPPDPGAEVVDPPDRQMERRVELDGYLEEAGEYYWTVRVVEIGGDGSTISEAPPRIFLYEGQATPAPDGG